MLANREGVFLATVGERSVAPNGPNKLATFSAVYKLVEELSPDGATDVSNEGMSITGYHYLETKDGQLNSFTIDKLKEATGWDGRDPFWLEESLPGDLVVKLTLAFNVYNGKQSLKVKYIDHRDSTGGGVVKSSDAEKIAIRNKLGSKLRTLAGGSPVKSPPPPALPPAMPTATSATATETSKPSMPVKRKKGAATVPAAAVGCTQEEAWKAFTKDVPANVTEEKTSSEWTRILNEIFPDKGDDDMKPEDWARVRDEGPSKFVPF